MNSLETVVVALGRVSLQAGLLAVIVVILQTLFRVRVSPRWRWARGWVVGLRLLLPTTLESPVSLFNLLPRAAFPAAAIVEPPVRSGRDNGERASAAEATPAMRIRDGSVERASSGKTSIATEAN